MEKRKGRGRPRKAEKTVAPPKDLSEKSHDDHLDAKTEERTLATKAARKNSCPRKEEEKASEGSDIAQDTPRRSRSRRSCTMAKKTPEPAVEPSRSTRPKRTCTTVPKAPEVAEEPPRTSRTRRSTTIVLKAREVAEEPPRKSRRSCSVIPGIQKSSKTRASTIVAAKSPVVTPSQTPSAVQKTQQEPKARMVFPKDSTMATEVPRHLLDLARRRAQEQLDDVGAASTSTSSAAPPMSKESAKKSGDDVPKKTGKDVAKTSTSSAPQKVAKKRKYVSNDTKKTEEPVKDVAKASTPSSPPPKIQKTVVQEVTRKSDGVLMESTKTSKPDHVSAASPKLQEALKTVENSGDDVVLDTSSATFPTPINDTPTTVEDFDVTKEATTSSSVPTPPKVRKIDDSASEKTETEKPGNNVNKASTSSAPLAKIQKVVEDSGNRSDSDDSDGYTFSTNAALMRDARRAGHGGDYPIIKSKRPRNYRTRAHTAPAPPPKLQEFVKVTGKDVSTDTATSSALPPTTSPEALEKPEATTAPQPVLQETKEVFQKPEAVDAMDCEENTTPEEIEKPADGVTTASASSAPPSEIKKAVEKSGNDVTMDATYSCARARPWSPKRKKSSRASRVGPAHPTIVVGGERVPFTKENSKARDKERRAKRRAVEEAIKKPLDDVADLPPLILVPKNVAPKPDNDVPMESGDDTAPKETQKPADAVASASSSSTAAFTASSSSLPHSEDIQRFDKEYDDPRFDSNSPPPCPTPAYYPQSPAYDLANLEMSDDAATSAPPPKKSATWEYDPESPGMNDPNGEPYDPMRSCQELTQEDVATTSAPPSKLEKYVLDAINYNPALDKDQCRAPSSSPLSSPRAGPSHDIPESRPTTTSWEEYKQNEVAAEEDETVQEEYRPSSPTYYDYSPTSPTYSPRPEQEEMLTPSREDNAQRGYSPSDPAYSPPQKPYWPSSPTFTTPPDPLPMKPSLKAVADFEERSKESGIDPRYLAQRLEKVARDREFKEEEEKHRIEAEKHYRNPSPPPVRDSSPSRFNSEFPDDVETREEPEQSFTKSSIFTDEEVEQLERSRRIAAEDASKLKESDPVHQKSVRSVEAVESTVPLPPPHVAQDEEMDTFVPPNIEDSNRLPRNLPPPPRGDPNQYWLNPQPGPSSAKPVIFKDAQGIEGSIQFPVRRVSQSEETVLVPKKSASGESGEAEVSQPPPAGQDEEKNPVVLPSITDAWRREGRLQKLTPWSTYDLDMLYQLLNRYGTSEDQLEFLAENGIDKTYAEIQQKIKEIRELAEEQAAIKKKFFVEYYTAKANDSRDAMELARKLPIAEQGGPGGGVNQWSAVALQLSGQYRQFNHAVVRDAISAALDAVPKTNFPSVVVSDSLASRHPGVEERLDYGKITSYIQKINSQTIGVNALPDLTPLEASVLLNIMEEIGAEARENLSLPQKAVVRGLLLKAKRSDFMDFAPDTPCNELTATQAYIDPFRTRDWDIPRGGRKVTQRDVDAMRPPGHPDAIEGDHDEGYINQNSNGRSETIDLGAEADTLREAAQQFNNTLPPPPPMHFFAGGQVDFEDYEDEVTIRQETARDVEMRRIDAQEDHNATANEEIEFDLFREDPTGYMSPLYKSPGADRFSRTPTPQRVLSPMDLSSPRYAPSSSLQLDTDPQDLFLMADHQDDEPTQDEPQDLFHDFQ